MERWAKNIPFLDIQESSIYRRIVSDHLIARLFGSTHREIKLFLLHYYKDYYWRPYKAKRKVAALANDLNGSDNGQ